MRHSVILLIGLLTCGWAPRAATYLVAPDGSGDFPDIRAAMDAASAGDVIELADGVFSGEGNRDIGFTKDLTVRSQSDDPAACIVDCGGSAAEPHCGFIFSGVCGVADGNLVGVTITQGYGAWGGAVLHNTIIAFSLAGEAILYRGSDSISTTCCDLYGNEGGDWTELLAFQLGVNGNFAADPLFCDAPAGDLRLGSDSPCSADNNPLCGQVGA